MDKQKRIKVGLCIALWISCIFDTVTFLGYGIFQFETNPLFLLTGQIWILLLLKFAVNLGLTYYLFWYKPKKSYKYAFLFILAILYAFVGQSMGGYLNMHTNTMYEETVGTPQEIQPMEQSAAVEVYSKVSLIILYLPMIMAFIAFTFFEKIYLVNSM